ncbi:helicase HerA-like domain-containing protein [Dietzia sp.]|uniref:helicase HerA-like domain-containing protein n=1 Tax=Dietzia sp. TaxID=1871616 RepID=UPI002FD90CD7
MPNETPASDPAAASTSESSPAQAIAQGYASEGSAVTLGSVLVDGTPHSDSRVAIPLSMINRHGLIAGATGTGKTKTLQLIAEQLSANGVPVVMADVKGDLSGLAKPGEGSEKAKKRADEAGVDWSPAGYPVEFLSLGTEGIGVPLRARVSSFGPILLSKVLGLNSTQESTLGLVFHWADEQGLELYDLKDLRAVLQYLTSDEGKEELKGIGGVSAQTAGVILRSLVNLSNNGGDTFFGDPELDPADLRQVVDGKGTISLIELGDQAGRPVLFSTFLMWILAELFHDLPEKGDADKPELVFIFDEAHLLFQDASKAFLEQVEQTVKLIRSKGVGVFFCSQLPTDIPGEILSQLGARIQHAFRAFTPEDQKALSKTVKTYPKSDVYDLEQALTGAGIGEAIVTVLSERGAPTPVAWTLMAPPTSLMNTIGNDAISEAAKGSAAWGKYGETVDPQSAYEKLEEKANAAAGAENVANSANAERAETASPAPAEKENASKGGGKDEGSFIERAMSNPATRSFMRSAASAAGREITRSLFGTRRRR